MGGTALLEDLLARKEGRRLVLLIGLTVVLWPMGLHATRLGSLFLPILDDPAQSGAIGALVCAAATAALVTLNVVLLDLLDRDLQVVVVWVELVILFLAFCWSFDLSYGFIAAHVGFLITQGAVTTVWVSLVSIAIACVIALVVALMKLSENGVAFGIASFYVSFFRGLPLLMQLYLIYLGLPQIGVAVDPIPAGITALAVCYGAYLAEIFRAGIVAIPRGQHDAAAALGLSRARTMRLVILPQAMRLIVPPTGNQFIAMLKDSSLVSVVGVWELTFLARTQGRAEFRHLEMLITAAIIYWLLSIVFELLQGRIERHYGKGDAR